MRKAPKALRLHIGLFGRRNVGKSSLLNALTRQDVAIVSDVAGTTTDPIEKTMELAPLGPVLFIDTAGIDDEGALGALRVERTRAALARCDVALIVTEGGAWGAFEAGLAAALDAQGAPWAAIYNKADLQRAEGEALKRKHAITSTRTGEGIGATRALLIELAPEAALTPPPVLSDLVSPGACVVLVTPIDKEAPKGRLIMPQVQAIRDALDGDAYCLVTKERELRHALTNLKAPPALVVTDSQAFLKVAADTPPEIPMTSFSVLFARMKGDLGGLVRGALAIDQLKSGDQVLIAEACTHHPITEDIGRVKIPRWLRQYVGGALEIEVKSGRDFPEDLSPYALVVHCGGCVWNRRAVLARQLRCAEAGVPMTNYGLAIAFTLGVFDRALGPFGGLDAFR
ncbi:[FeFe] hydrogenase H-cluster maturation GTPase HydF [Myxococcota bacterium]|nr:[FeFe] hydrogenase H-cluster maturation GTPase HydF [Myxococcota bacterium]MBU1429309.1 [FeFe] hydrogenase H-cluster maturation GTPase HydF [Myxococcota bacterium]MBU1897943.1 [FeFe] hydrogenase H-cluster maturation GTPase HydF [Myxococcota bacterium]